MRRLVLRPWHRAIFVLIGAISGFLLALFLELTGHSSWYFLAMLIGASAPSLILLVKDIPAIDTLRHRLPRWSQFSLILLMIAITLGAEWFFDADSRGYSYLPLLVPVIVSAVLFGFGLALFAIAVAVLAADYFFVPPVYSFVLTEWEDALGLAVFAIVGAFVALSVVELLNFGRD